MLDELRSNPRAPQARSRGRRPGGSGVTEGDAGYPGLSTGFADGGRIASTGAAGPVHRPGWGIDKEGVG